MTYAKRQRRSPHVYIDLYLQAQSRKNPTRPNLPGRTRKAREHRPLSQPLLIIKPGQRPKAAE